MRLDDFNVSSIKTAIDMQTKVSYSTFLGVIICTSLVSRWRGKAIPIKCFVSHRRTDPFFSKSKQTEIPDSLVKEASILI